MPTLLRVDMCCVFCAVAWAQEETAEERGRRIASQWTHDPEAAGVPVSTPPPPPPLAAVDLR